MQFVILTIFDISTSPNFVNVSQFLKNCHFRHFSQEIDEKTKFCF